jgi:hypothetical protein
MKPTNMNTFGLGFIYDEWDGDGMEEGHEMALRESVDQNTFGIGTGSTPPIGTGVYRAGSYQEDMDQIGVALGESYPRLNDLEWLENVEQDAKRLPVNPVDRSIKELVHQWKAFRGGDERIEGVSETGAYVPYRLSDLNGDPDYYEKKVNLSDLNIKDTIRSEMSKMASGVDKRLVLHNIKNKLGSKFSEYKEYIINQYGLIKKSANKKSNMIRCSRCASNDCKCDTTKPVHNELVDRLDDKLKRRTFDKPRVSKLEDKRSEYVNQLSKTGLYSDSDINIIKSYNNLSDMRKVANAIINRPRKSSYDGVIFTQPESGLLSVVTNTPGNNKDKVVKHENSKLRKGSIAILGGKVENPFNDMEFGSEYDENSDDFVHSNEEDRSDYKNLPGFSGFDL